MLPVSKNFKDAVYAPIRKITARIHFTLYGDKTTYDDTVIMNLNILEEMNIYDTVPANEIKVTLDNSSGVFNFLKLQNMQEIIGSRPKIEVEFGLVFEEEPFVTFYQTLEQSIEWVPMGTYYLSEWKNEKATMSVSLIARDNFDMLSEISYENSTGGSLHNVAVDILEKAGITNYVISDSLKNISTSGFPERLDSRAALQHIGIAARSAVLQDRHGKIIIKPFAVLDASSNYLNHAGQNNMYFGTVYPAVTNGFGMKIIDYDNVYEEPEITLDKSIYEVVVNVYEPTGAREVVFRNSSINGKSGSSFKIENPLINTESLAEDVAEWIIKESNYNAIYKTVWRQNPILECADVVLVEDSFQAKKQTRIYRQEFEFAGYLSGVTESRGGV